MTPELFHSLLPSAIGVSQLPWTKGCDSDPWLSLLVFRAGLLNFGAPAFTALLAFCLFKLWKKEDTGVHTVPYAIPILRSTIPFVFNGLTFLKHASKHIPAPSTIRVPIFMDDVYVVQGPKNVTEVFQNHHLTVTRAYSLVLQQCFGMRQSAVDAYLADTSGSRAKPIAGSSAAPSDRISFMTHENLVSGLLQEGLGPAGKRYEKYLNETLEDEARQHKANHGQHTWRDAPDFDKFFQVHIGSSLVKALFGEQLLKQAPNFIEHLWEYDKNVIRLAQRIPSFWMPNTYAIRDRLLATVRAWHSKGRAYIGVTKSEFESEEESCWGTKMMRDRHAMLLNATGQDQDSVASTDLAFIWASVTNVVPSTMTLAYHIFSSPRLLSSLRESLTRLPRNPTVKDLESIPLLVSMYAETLRFGVQIHIPRSAPYRSLRIGGVDIPNNKLIMANTWLAHTDEQVWNTKDGTRPLDHFWPERFLVDPSDPTSGPTRKKSCGSQPDHTEGKDVTFSVEGLEGSWIPFGGGLHACPGRLLAKRIMLVSIAVLLAKFDVEFPNDLEGQAVEFGSARFGFGVRKPEQKVRFRIRPR